MNSEDRMLVELKYGIDLSYKSFEEFTALLKKLPPDFRKKYKYGYFFVMLNGETDNFKETLLQRLLEHKEENEK